MLCVNRYVNQKLKTFINRLAAEIIQYFSVCKNCSNKNKILIYHIWVVFSRQDSFMKI